MGSLLLFNPQLAPYWGCPGFVDRSIGVTP